MKHIDRLVTGIATLLLFAIGAGIIVGFVYLVVVEGAVWLWLLPGLILAYIIGLVFD